MLVPLTCRTPSTVGVACRPAPRSLQLLQVRVKAPARPMRVASGNVVGSSLPDDLCFSVADQTFLRAMAMRPKLPDHNIGWDDAVGDHSSIDGWHAQAWQMWGQAAATTAADTPAGPEEGQREWQ